MRDLSTEPGEFGAIRTGSRNMLRVAFLVAAVFGFTLGWAAVAYAFPLDNACGSKQTTLTYSFHNQANGGDRDWTSDEKSQVTNGANEWEKVPDPFGGDHINVVKYADNTSADWAVEVHDLDTNSIGSGVTTCSGEDRIKLDLVDDFETLTDAEIRALAAHEFGHGADLKHAGEDDSFDLSRPTMAVCPDSGVPIPAEQQSIEQDDYANLEYRYSSSLTSAHANTSFENSYDTFWGYAGGASGDVINGGASDGSYYLKMYPGSGGSGYMYQTSRVIDPKDMRARVNFKKYYTSSSGQIYYAIYARKLDYSVATDPCQLAANNKHDWDFNDPDIVEESFTFRVGTWKTPTTSWQWPDTAEWTAVDGWDGVDARIYIYNYMELSGQPTYVRLDHARIRHT